MNRAPVAPRARFSPTAPATTPASSAVSGLAELLGARVHIDVTIPRTTIRGRMRLVSHTESSTINADARKHFVNELGLEVNTTTLLQPGVMGDWNATVAVRTLAVAVRDPVDDSKPLGPLSDWSECDVDQIAALWLEYKDLATKLDPLGDMGDGLTEEQFAELRTLVKKKGGPQATLFDSLTRALSETTSADPPAT